MNNSDRWDRNISILVDHACIYDKTFKNYKAACEHDFPLLVEALYYNLESHLKVIKACTDELEKKWKGAP